MQAAQANPDIGFFVDAPYPGAPLLISFGYVDWAAPNRFDFAGRTRKLMNARGARLNRIFVRDTANMWYHHGVQGLGQSVDETVALLANMIDDIWPSSLMTIGQSMGAWAALLFGALLNADRSLAFGPLSYFRGDWAREDRDMRFVAVMDRVNRFPPDLFFEDLPSVFQMCARLPDIRIIYGNGPSEGDPGGLDQIHADRFAQFQNVSITRYDEAPHAIVHWLIEQKRIDDVLAEWLFQPDSGQARPPMGIPLPPLMPVKSFDEGDQQRVRDALQRRTPMDDILALLVGEGHHPGEAQRELYKAERAKR